MSQTIDNNTPHLASEVGWKEKYYVNFYTHRQDIISPRIIEEMSKDLVKWAANNEKALKLSQFYLEKGIASSTFYYFMDKYPVLKNAAKCARELIGNRREIGGLLNKLNPSIVMSQMPKYDESWMDLEKKRAEIKAKALEKVNPDIKYVIAVEDFSDKTNNKEQPK